MVIHRRPAAAAQVSVCAVMTVIAEKEFSCNCGRAQSASSVPPAHTSPAFVLMPTLLFIP